MVPQLLAPIVAQLSTEPFTILSTSTIIELHQRSCDRYWDRQCSFTWVAVFTCLFCVMLRLWWLAHRCHQLIPHTVRRWLIQSRKLDAVRRRTKWKQNSGAHWGNRAQTPLGGDLGGSQPLVRRHRKKLPLSRNCLPTARTAWESICTVVREWRSWAPALWLPWSLVGRCGRQVFKNSDKEG